MIYRVRNDFKRTAETAVTMIHSMCTIERKDMKQKQPDGSNVDCCTTDMLVHELAQGFMAEYELS